MTIHCLHRLCFTFTLVLLLAVAYGAEAFAEKVKEDTDQLWIWTKCSSCRDYLLLKLSASLYLGTSLVLFNGTLYHEACFNGTYNLWCGKLEITQILITFAVAYNCWCISSIYCLFIDTHCVILKPSIMCQLLVLDSETAACFVHGRSSSKYYFFIVIIWLCYILCVCISTPVVKNKDRKLSFIHSWKAYLRISYLSFMLVPEWLQP